MCDHVYYYIGERLKLEGETENMGVWTKKRGSMEYVVLLDSTLREGQLGAWLISSKRLTADSNAEQDGMQDTQGNDWAA